MDSKHLPDSIPDELAEQIAEKTGDGPMFVLRAEDGDGEPVLNDMGGLMVEIPTELALRLHKQVTVPLVEHQKECDGRHYTVEAVVWTPAFTNTMAIQTCPGGTTAAFDGTLQNIQEMAESNGAEVEMRGLTEHLGVDTDSLRDELSDEDGSDDWTGIDID